MGVGKDDVSLVRGELKVCDMYEVDDVKHVKVVKNI